MVIFELKMQVWIQDFAAFFCVVCLWSAVLNKIYLAECILDFPVRFHQNTTFEMFEPCSALFVDHNVHCECSLEQLNAFDSRNSRPQFRPLSFARITVVPAQFLGGCDYWQKIMLFPGIMGVQIWSKNPFAFCFHWFLLTR